MATDNCIRMLVLFPLPTEAIRRMQELAPDMRIDQLQRADPGYDDALAQAHIIVGWPPIKDLGKAVSLRWLQIASAGANRYVEAVPPQVTLTNASGVFGIPIAEHVFAMMLCLTRGIPTALRAAGDHVWEPEATRKTLDELHGSICGVVGLGDIGTEVAKRAHAFGMRVMAVKRSVGGKPPFVDELADIGGLDRLLGVADHVVITLPGTPHTRHLIDARRLSLMKPGAYIYNVGRGSVIDEDALIKHLRDGRIAGAGLDVFEREPLPADSPLWDMPNVIVTAHRAGSTPRHGERLAEIVLRNLAHYLAEEPLQNVVDRELGY